MAPDASPLAAGRTGSTLALGMAVDVPEVVARRKRRCAGLLSGIAVEWALMNDLPTLRKRIQDAWATLIPPSLQRVLIHHYLALEKCEGRCGFENARDSEILKKLKPCRDDDDLRQLLHKDLEPGELTVLHFGVVKLLHLLRDERGYVSKGLLQRLGDQPDALTVARLGLKRLGDPGGYGFLRALFE